MRIQPCGPFRIHRHFASVDVLMPISRAACEEGMRSSMGDLLYGDQTARAIARNDERCRKGEEGQKPGTNRDHDRDSVKIEVIYPELSA